MIVSVLGVFAYFNPPTMTQRERTFIMLKPDAVHRGLVGEIITRFEKRGYKLVGMKFMQAPRSLLEEHYAEHKGRPFYEGLVNYMVSGPVCPMVWEGTEVIATSRKMIGETKPLASAPGSIRGDYGIDVGRNLVHGSDAAESASREIDLWFKPSELSGNALCNWTPVCESWVYE